MVGLMKTDYTEEDLSYIKLESTSYGNASDPLNEPSF